MTILNVEFHLPGLSREARLVKTLGKRGSPNFGGKGASVGGVSCERTVLQYPLVFVARIPDLLWNVKAARKQPLQPTEAKGMAADNNSKWIDRAIFCNRSSSSSIGNRASN